MFVALSSLKIACKIQQFIWTNRITFKKKQGARLTDVLRKNLSPRTTNFQSSISNTIQV